MIKTKVLGTTQLRLLKIVKLKDSTLKEKVDTLENQS